MNKNIIFRKEHSVQRFLNYVLLFSSLAVTGIVFYSHSMPGRYFYRYIDKSNNGLRKFVYNNAKWEGECISTGIDGKINFNNESDINFRRDYFSVRWAGVFNTHRRGMYKFWLSSDDSSNLIIDNKLVIDNSGIHPALEKKKTVFLFKGFHTFVLYYSQAKDKASVSFGFKKAKKEEKASDLSVDFYPVNEQFDFNEYQEVIEKSNSLQLWAIGFFFFVLFIWLLYITARLVNYSTIVYDGYIPDKAIKYLNFILFLLIFVMAVLARISHYVNYPYLICKGIGNGSDFQFHVTNALCFPKNHWFFGGNQGFIIWILGGLFYLFGVYPGLHYFAIILIFLSSFVCLVPYIIVSKLIKKPSLGGFIAGLILVFNPLIVNETPKPESNILGLFVLSLYVIFFYRILFCKKIYDYILFGFFIFLMLITRDVFIVILGPSICIYLLAAITELWFAWRTYKSERVKIIYGKTWKLLMPVLVFFMCFSIFDAYVEHKTGRSYLSQNFGAINYSKIQNSDFKLKSKSMIERINEWIKEKTENFPAVISTIKSYDLEYSRIDNTRIFKYIIILEVIYIVLMCLLTFIRRIYFFIPVFLVGFCYSFILVITIVAPDYLIPLVFFFSIQTAFVFELFISFVSYINNKISIFSGKTINLCFYLLTGMLFVFCTVSSVIRLQESTKKNKSYITYLKWAGNVIPENSVIFTGACANPWDICSLTGKPVAHNMTYGSSMYVDKAPYRQSDFKQITDVYAQKGIQGGDKVFEEMFREGKTFIVLDIDGNFLGFLETCVLKNEGGYVISGTDYRLIKYKDYPGDNLYKSVYLLKHK